MWPASTETAEDREKKEIDLMLLEDDGGLCINLETGELHEYDPYKLGELGMLPDEVRVSNMSTRNWIVALRKALKKEE